MSSDDHARGPPETRTDVVPRNTVSTSTSTYYVRRGNSVKGPIPSRTVAELLKAGTLKPTDEIASTPGGPWIPLQQAFRKSKADAVVIDTFELKRTLFGSGFIAMYDCPKCKSALQSDEAEWGQGERCPTCGLKIRISPRAQRAASDHRAADARKKAEAAAAALALREHKEAARREALAQHERERQAALESRQHVEAVARAEEQARVSTSLTARARPGACWYCGAPHFGRLPQCVACRLPRRA